MIINNVYVREALNMFDIMQYTIILIFHFMNGYVKDLVCLNFSNDHAALIPCFKYSAQ